MHILVIHQYYLGAGDAGGSRFNEMARLWTEMGHQVTIVAGTVNYQTGKKLEQYRGRWVAEETAPGGIRVRRAYVSASYNRNLLGRLWGYVSFMLSATHAGVTAERPDVIIATSPPLLAGLSGWVASRRWRAPLVFEVRDLWPDSVIDAGVLSPGLMARILYWIEGFLYRRADRVNVLTPAFRTTLLDQKGVPDDKIIFVPNGADLDLFRPGDRQNWVREKYGLQDRFIAMYLGAHGVANHLEQIIEAAELLRDRTDIVFLLVGDGMRRPALDQMVRERGLENVILVGGVPKEAAVDFCNAADVCVAVLKKIDTFKTVYPNKVFDYMACARPVVLGIDGVARRLVEEAGAGMYVEPENATAIAEAVVRLASDPELAAGMGASGREFVTANFAREKLAARYADELQRLGRN